MIGINAAQDVDACLDLDPILFLVIGLELIDDRFLNRERTLILCSTHGALFRIEDGYCVDGPCDGEWLERLDLEVRDGEVYLRG